MEMYKRVKSFGIFYFVENVDNNVMFSWKGTQEYTLYYAKIATNITSAKPNAI